MQRDVGALVGRYLQSVAILFAISSVYLLGVDGQVYSGVIVLLLWAGTELRRHTPIARRLVLLGCSLSVGAAAVLVLVSTYPLEGVALPFFGIPVSNSSGVALLPAAMLLLVAAVIPLLLLFTPRADAEFRIREGA